MSVVILAALFFFEAVGVYGYVSSSLGLLLFFASIAIGLPVSKLLTPAVYGRFETRISETSAAINSVSAVRLGFLLCMAGSLSLILANSINPVSRSVLAFKFIGLLLTLVAFLFASRYFETQPEARKAQLAYWLRAIGICAIPVALNGLLVNLIFHKGLLDLTLFDKEDMFYWHQSKTFSQVFFSGGYYTSFERPATLAFTHFGNHGFVFPMIYGTLGRLFGWHSYSIPLFNHLLFGATLLVYINIARPARQDLPLIALFVATFSPVALYLVSSRSDGFQLAAGVLAAGLFVWLQRRPGFGTATVSLTVVFVLTLSRPTWGILFIPFVYLAMIGLPWARRIALSLAIGLGLAYIAYQLWALSAAPYTLNLPFAQGSQAMAAAAGREVFDLLGSNLREFAAYRPFSSGGVVVWGTVALVVILLTGALKPVLALRTWKLASWLKEHETGLLLALILGGVFVFLFPFLGFAARAERYLSSFLIFTCLVFFVTKKYRPLLLLVLLWQIAALPSAYETFEQYFRPYYESPYPQKDFARMQRIVDEYVHFVPGANPWCNTLLTEVTPPTFMSIPAGIGMSTSFEDTDTNLYTLPFNSRYIILDRFIEGQDWQFLALTPYGGLYLNPESACDLPTQQQ